MPQPQPEQPHVTDDLLDALNPGGHSSRPNLSPSRNAVPSRSAIGWGSKPPKFDEEVNPDATWAPAPAGSWWKTKKPPPEGKDANVTIASLQTEVKTAIRQKNQAKQSSRELDHICLKSPMSKRRGKRGRKKDNRQLRDPIDSDEEDAAGEAAYDDYMSNLAAQMEGNDSSGDGSQRFAAIPTTHSAAIGGPSLVVDGKEIADDEVLDYSYIQMGGDDTSSTSSDPIGQDLSEISDDGDSNYSDIGSSELERDLEYTEREQWKTKRICVGDGKKL